MLAVFAIIVGCNCICAGMMLIIYILFYNFVHGIVFYSLNSFVDSLVETMYTLFPLIYLTTGSSIFDLRSLGLLKQQNWFILFQSVIAMILLLSKHVKLTRNLNPYHIAQEYWQIQLGYNHKNHSNIKFHSPWYVTQYT